MKLSINKSQLIRAAKAVKRRLPAAITSPACAMILGSGWSEAATEWPCDMRVPYSDIPGLGDTEVAGHGGCLTLATVSRRSVLIFHGRRHWYEGRGWTPVVAPVFIAKELGFRRLLLTNASGGVNRRFLPGSVMMLEDHVNLMGVNPLVGAHGSLTRTRFPDMTAVYDHELRRQLSLAAKKEHVRLYRGIYAAVSGPSYETPAEIAVMRRMGIDAVGMSTVPEAVFASACGIKVAALSFMANAAARPHASLKHEDVLHAVHTSVPILRRLMRRFVQLLP